jgi:23S rRNA (guanosine2251-2'-O)-methyltransferase
MIDMLMSLKTLILSDIRSTYNVGSILRTAECFGVKEAYYAGYTPYPLIEGDQRLPHLSKKINSAIHKTALGAEQYITGLVFNDTLGAIKHAKSQGLLVVALEQSVNSVHLSDFKSSGEFALVLGNEVTGLSKDILKACDQIIEIPQMGKKESLNVSSAAAITLYNLSREK